jgi:hypothetical protein
MNASEVRHSQFVGFVDDHAYFPWRLLFIWCLFSDKR